MKLFAYIVSFHILFLALEPGVKAICSLENKTECCNSLCKIVSDEKSQPEKHPVKKDAGCQSDCNPFSSCCSGYTLVLTLISLSPEIFQTEQYTTVTENFLSETSIDFWQPPKIG